MQHGQHDSPSHGIGCESDLPICHAWDEIIRAVAKNQVVVVTGDTGSGKSTQLPKLCLAAGRGQKRLIGVTQPRRIAATSVAARVARELASTCPQGTVGYKIRFAQKTGPKTRIKFMTDGILLSEIQHDRLLNRYDTIIVDEAHERSLNIDLILGLLKKILPKREDLRVIITSATMDLERILHAFDNPPLIQVSGRTYPVEIVYRPYDHLPDSADLTIPEKAVLAVEDIRSIDPFGDILIFMPTEAEIHQTVKMLDGRLGKDAVVLPLFGRLTKEAQERVFRSFPVQKILVATNIAETSITVPGIRYVIDSGLARISQYNVNTHTTNLPVERISQASAAQRAGRAGRVEAGLCIRLYSQEEFESMPAFTPPEILRCSLAEVVLRLISLGQEPVEDFPFVDPPDRKALKEALHTLKELGAVKTDRSGRLVLTRRGRQMSRLPIDPRLSAVILQARQDGVLLPALVVSAALSIQDPRQFPPEDQEKARQAHRIFLDERSDFLTILNIWDRYQARKTKDSKGALRRFCKKSYISYVRMNEWTDLVSQLARQLSDIGIKLQLSIETSCMEMVRENSDPLHRSILAGFLGNLAIKQDKGDGYRGAKGKEIFIFPGSALFKKAPQWIVSAQQVRTSRLFARSVAPVDPAWAEELGKHLCRRSLGEPWWSRARGEALVTENITLYGLPVVKGRRRGLKGLDPAMARELFIREGLSLHQLRYRYRFVKHNILLIRELQEIEDRTRSHGYLAEQEVLIGFYRERLKMLEEKAGREVVDELTFRRALRETGLEDLFLIDRETLLKRDVSADLAQFPGFINSSGHELPLVYRFAPGEQEDGITCRIPLTILNELEPEPFQWLVPGMLQEKVEFILKNLPSPIRKNLLPISQSAVEFIEKFSFGDGDLFLRLQELIIEKTGHRVDLKESFATTAFPLHLLMRFEVLDLSGEVIASGRDLDQLKHSLNSCARDQITRQPEWKQAAAEWEQELSTPYSIPELPDTLLLKQKGRLMAYPGLKLMDGKTVRITLFVERAERDRESVRAIHHIACFRLNKELSHIKRSVIPRFAGPKQAVHSSTTMRKARGWPRTVMDNCFNLIVRQCVLDRIDPFSPVSLITKQSDLDRLLAQIRRDLVRCSEELMNHIALSYQAFCSFSKEYASAKEGFGSYPAGREILQEVGAAISILFPPSFPDSPAAPLLGYFTRYLKGLSLRLQRAGNSSSRDIAKGKDTREIRKRARQYLMEQMELQLDARDQDRFLQILAALMELEMQIYAPEYLKKGANPLKTLKVLLDPSPY